MTLFPGIRCKKKKKKNERNALIKFNAAIALSNVRPDPLQSNN